MNRLDNTSAAIALMLERLPRLLYERRSPADMHPGQWAALRYLARANASARNVNAVARYFGITAAPASRSVTALMRKGLLDRRDNPEDRRSMILDVSKQGHDLLAKDPIMSLIGAIEQLDNDERRQLGYTLERIAEQIEGHSHMVD